MDDKPRTATEIGAQYLNALQIAERNYDLYHAMMAGADALDRLREPISPVTLSNSPRNEYLMRHARTLRENARPLKP